MNKNELIEAIASTADLPKKSAALALEAVTDTIMSTLQKGEDVALIGFGSFTVKHRAARTGRNPQTGEPLEIKAAKLPAFKAGKRFKDVVKGNVEK